jgi:hypothetical protein
VLQAGVAMMPGSPYLHLVYSSFLIEVRHNNQQGWAQLEMARKMDLNLSFEFSIFTREQVNSMSRAANMVAYALRCLPGWMVGWLALANGRMDGWEPGMYNPHPAVHRLSSSP